MIFGISVSDIYGCAHLAYRLYDEFKKAPGACQEFARDLLLFHQVLLKTKSTIESEASHLSHSDQTALGACLESCKELLYVQIMGDSMVPTSLTEPETGPFPFGSPTPQEFRFLQGWRQKFDERRLALRIPKLQRAITVRIEQLTTLNVLIIQSQQNKNQDSQKRIEECVGESHNLLVKLSTDYALQLDSISDRLETSQSRIESQFQTILANQQRSKTPILSQSLDASSPEGRQTWMESGRLLRDEGITPAMIQKNRELLVNAMKDILRNKTLSADSTPQSYATAPEYHADNNTTTLSVTQPRSVCHQGLPPISSAISLLGSAPPRSSGFPDAFIERQNGAASSLEKEQNVNDGMQSLLQGMSCDKVSRDFERAAMDDSVFGCVERERALTYRQDRQKQGVNPVLEPLVPVMKRGDSMGKFEKEDTGADFATADTKPKEPIHDSTVSDRVHRLEPYQSGPYNQGSDLVWMRYFRTAGAKNK